MDQAGLKDPKIQNFGPPSANEVLVDLGMQETSEAALLVVTVVVLDGYFLAVQ